MKRNILFVLVLFISSSNLLLAQKERIIHLQNFDKRTIHFGYYLGMNNLGYKISYKSRFEHSPTRPLVIEDYVILDDYYITINQSLGFNIGFVVDYRLHKNINLRFEPGLMSNTKELNFVNPYISPINKDYIGGTQITERKVSSTYLHLPLLFKFSSNRLNNIRPYVIAGASYDYNFSSNEGNSDDNYDVQFRTKTNNFMYEVGIGMDFYFYFFKFSPSIRGVFAINNELKRDNLRPYTSDAVDGGTSLVEGPWTSPIDYFGTRGIYLNLTFE